MKDVYVCMGGAARREYAYTVVGGVGSVFITFYSANLLPSHEPLHL